MRPHAQILIVEDEPILALDLQRRFRRLGYVVAEVPGLERTRPLALWPSARILC